MLRVSSFFFILISLTSLLSTMSLLVVLNRSLHCSLTLQRSLQNDLYSPRSHCHVSSRYIFSALPSVRHEKSTLSHASSGRFMALLKRIIPIGLFSFTVCPQNFMSKNLCPDAGHQYRMIYAEHGGRR